MYCANRYELAADDYAQNGYIPKDTTENFAEFLRTNTAIWDDSGDDTILRPLAGFSTKFAAWYVQMVVETHPNVGGMIVESSWETVHGGWAARFDTAADPESARFRIDGHDGTSYETVIENVTSAGTDRNGWTVTVQSVL